MGRQVKKQELTEAQKRRFRSLAKQGYGREEVARSFGVHPNVVDRWVREEGLVLVKHAGRNWR